jgi:hypothetical protein
MNIFWCVFPEGISWFCPWFGDLSGCPLAIELVKCAVNPTAPTLSAPDFFFPSRNEKCKNVLSYKDPFSVDDRIPIIFVDTIVKMGLVGCTCFTCLFHQFNPYTFYSLTLSLFLSIDVYTYTQHIKFLIIHFDSRAANKAKARERLHNEEYIYSFTFLSRCPDFSVMCIVSHSSLLLLNVLTLKWVTLIPLNLFLLLLSLIVATKREFRNWKGFSLCNVRF